MVYENSGCTKDEIKAVHDLVSQVTRAFFDPHFVILMDRMMTSDMHLEPGLGHQVGISGGVSATETNVGKLLKLLQKQRLVKSFLNYENSAGRGTDGLPLSKRQTMKRTYWYIDYHDFMLVVKYRLAVMRSRIEASMVKDDTARSDYKCPQCQKEFDALQIPSLIQNLAMSMIDREGDFIVACDVCGEQLEPKMNEKEQSEADKKMEKFNNALAQIRRSLQRVEKIEFDRFEPINWLLNHVKDTIIVERDARGKRAYVAFEKRRPNPDWLLTPEEKLAKIEAEEARKAEVERNKGLLPAWAVSSTVTGQQTELGVKHDKLQQVRAEREARAMMGQQDVKVDTTDADLDAHYAKLMAEAAGGESSSALKDEPGSSRAGSLGPGNNEDGDDDMEAVDTSGNKAEDIEALKNTMVQVDTEEMRYGDITDDDLDRMTTDQYTNYYRIADELQQLEDSFPTGI